MIDTLPLPPRPLRFMGESDEDFVRIGRALARRLEAGGMVADSMVLDVGSGYGRLVFGLLAEGVHQGRYVGFDILAKHVAWCRRNITAADDRFRFKHINARNQRYNPGGDIDPDEIRFPVKAGTVDVAAVFSVFTHLHQPTIEHYLDELARVLKPGRAAVTTWFLWDEQRRPALESDACAHPMRHQLAPDILYKDESDPLHAIAYHQRLVEPLARAAGLRVRSLTRGNWDGVTDSDAFQDLVVLERPDTLRLKARRTAGKVKRAVRRRR